MILIGLIVLLLGGGLLAWVAGRAGPRWSRWISAATVSLGLVLTVGLWGRHYGLALSTGAIGPSPGAAGGGVMAAPAPMAWLEEVDLAWIPAFGVRFHLALDGLSLLMLLLTFALGLAAVASAWTEITARVGFFYFNLLWILAGLVGVFVAMDLFLFYFFWELMLIPMYFLISIWGYERRVYAAIKFFLFTQASSLFMLLSIIGLYFVHGRQTGVFTFDFPALVGTRFGPTAGLLMMLGFFVAFAVKLPMVPLHTWLADAHTEAPTAGSVILAGLLLKTGAYGLLRFVLPLFPEAVRQIAPVVLVLAVGGILYGALLAFAQTDLKRLVAYTSVSHLGFVLLGIFSFNEAGHQGAVMEMICHGLSTGGLFILVGALYESLHTRDLRRLGGLWSVAPRMGGAAMVLAMASLGLPGLGNFVAEFLVLLGSFRVNVPLTVLATVGLVIASIYSLWLMQRAFFGPNPEGWRLPDLSGRATAVLGGMIALLVWLGLYPQPVLDTAAPALARDGVAGRGGAAKRAAGSEAAREEPEPGAGSSSLSEGESRGGV